MKKTLSLLMILVIVGILVLGASVAYAAAVPAEVNSQACFHASETGKLNANQANSVLGSCGVPPG